MNCLIVFAHPEPFSFNAALKDRAVHERVTAAEREAYLDAFADRLRRLAQTEPLFFHPWADYDETQRLKPGVSARSGVQWNPQTGQTFEAAAVDFAQRQAVPLSRT